MCRKEIRAIIIALFLLAVGGLLLHLRIHPPTVDASNWLPVISCIISAVALPVMFNYRPTVAWAYIINLAAIVVGTVAMAHYSISNWQGPVTWRSVTAA